MSETPRRRLLTDAGHVVAVRPQGPDAELTVHPGGHALAYHVRLSASNAHQVADWLRDCVTPEGADAVASANGATPVRPAEVVALFLAGQVDDAGRKLFDLTSSALSVLDSQLTELALLARSAHQAKVGHFERTTLGLAERLLAPSKGGKR